MEEKFSHEEEQEGVKNSPFPTKEGLNKLPVDRFADEYSAGGNTFCRAEKLKSRKLIEQLFKEGKSVSNNGFTLFYLPVSQPDAGYPAQAAFSVPKRHFKRAVDRNRAKRIMREVYRQNKWMLYAALHATQAQWVLLWLFRGKQTPAYRAAETAMKQCLTLAIAKAAKH